MVAVDKILCRVQNSEFILLVDRDQRRQEKLKEYSAVMSPAEIQSQFRVSSRL